MSHFLTVSINENGVIVDDKLDSTLSQALNQPFNFSDVFIYSHGWWTTGTRAMDEYNRFSIEFARLVMTLAANAPPTLPNLPSASLGIGIHWPSMLSEDENSIVNFGQALSFYTMEKRADTVGEHGVYSILRLILQGKTTNPSRLRVHWLGHSFGCKVVCSALQEIVDDRATVQVPNNVTLKAVLLQAAFDDDDLEKGDVYGGLAQGLPGLRILATRSDEDKALQTWYPKAHLVNFFRPDNSRVALGGGGPTKQVIQQFGGVDKLDVAKGFSADALAPINNRFVVANLTPLHKSSAEPSDSFSGRHSDIFHEEIYNLIAGFLFKYRGNTP